LITTSHDPACSALLDLAVVGELAELEDGPDCTYLSELFEKFASDARAALQSMRGLATCGNATAIARQAHRLRGSSGSIGAARLAIAYGQIELRARSGDIGRLAVQIEKTARLLDATLEALREFRPAGMPAGCRTNERTAI